MKKILIGMIMDGKAGGIDKYLLNFYDTVKDQFAIDFLTNKKDSELEDYLNQNNTKLFEISSLMHPIKQYKQAKELILKNKYDTLYVNISTALAFPLLKAGYDCGIEVIVHSHSAGYDCESGLKRRVFTFLHYICKGFVCRFSNRFFACSDKAAEWMFNKKINRNKNYKIIYNAIDTTKYNYDPELRQKIRKELGVDDGFVIGNVGNICYQKNHTFLIDVFYELLKREPNSYLVIIGDGVLMPKIKEKISEYDIADRVKLLGRVDTSRGYMNAFDVFALPSNFEGLGIVYIEAQYTKVPCIASDKVPDIAKISNMFSFVPLHTEKWVNQILEYKNIKKDDFVFENTEMFDLSKQKNELISILSAENGMLK